MSERPKTPLVPKVGQEKTDSERQPSGKTRAQEVEEHAREHPDCVSAKRPTCDCPCAGKLHGPFRGAMYRRGDPLPMLLYKGQMVYARPGSGRRE